MTGPCGTCRHWDQDDRARGPLPVDYGNGSRWEERLRERNADVGMCQAAVFAPDVQYDDPVPALMVQDGSDYRAALFTRRDFGCVLHEVAP